MHVTVEHRHIGR